jgi:hypothetical protein
MTVRESADRLRRFTNGEGFADVYQHGEGYEAVQAAFQLSLADERAVIAAYLAEHDETPIDEAWLKCIGGLHDHSVDDVRSVVFVFPDPHGYPDGQELRLWNVGDGWRADIKNKESGVASTVSPTGFFNTRGDARRLAAALGIDLQEPRQ